MHLFRLGRFEIKNWRPAVTSPSLALTLATLFWSGNFIAGRALRSHIDPVTLNFARWLIALILFAPFVWRDVRNSTHVLRREWHLIVASARAESLHSTH
jgi:drug/metabolite transporter (DMT)-like permease